MGLVKKIKKAVKGATSLKGLAGIVAAPFTGGLSLYMTSYEAMKGMQKDDKSAQMAALVQQKEAKEEEERKKIKMETLQENNQRYTGLSSLIGKHPDTLG